MNSEILEILHVMEIPVWIPKNRKLSIQSIQSTQSTPSLSISTNARYALILGCMGQWDAQTHSIKEDQFNMLKRLILALNWDFASCMIGEVNVEGEGQEALMKVVKNSNLEKIILFGNEVAKLAQVLGSHCVEVIVVPSVEDLMRDAIAKREAWGRLLPHKRL